MYYFVPFKDKQGTPYQISKPEEFLSSRSLERRKKQNIVIVEEDLPLNPAYISQIKAKNAKVQYATKWLNGVVVLCDESTLNQVKTLDFVKKDEIKVIKTRPTTESERTANNKRTYKTRQNNKNFIENFDFSKKDYGYSYNQIQMIAADEMHKKGYFGENIIMAIFDSGFSDADKQTYFKHLFENGQILDTYDFVMNEKSVYEDDDHGRMVLSCIAAWQKGLIAGTAPKAQFYLFRTEDASSEFVIEEYNWLAAAERADSLGVDIISSSLGYTNFDDKNTSYQIKDLDGKTAVSTRAAEIASQKGIVVITSAGNEGGSAWGKISAPADAASVLSIGAVNSRGAIAYFSSRGNTADGRIKPDVLAMGSGATVGGNNSDVTTSSGTSFSCPITAGLVAGFWQANPQLSSKQVVEYIRRSGNQYAKPDSIYGYGLVNFLRADYLAKRETLPDGIMTGQNPDEIMLYPNPYNRSKEMLPIIAWGANYRGKKIEVKIYDNKSKLVSTIHVDKADKEIVLEQMKEMPAGEYIITISPNTSKQPSWRIVVE
ncbi:MAG: S8 family serine peptidase [Raineya sp.]